MNESSIQESYRHITLLLEARRLKEAQTQLEAYLWDCKDWTLRNRLEQAQTSYQYMLQYLRQGINDPEREKVYQQLLAETWEIADQAHVLLLDSVSGRYYHQLRRHNAQQLKKESLDVCLKALETFTDDMAIHLLMPENKEGLEETLQRHEKMCQYLFNSTWCNAWTGAEEAQARQFLASELLPVSDLCLMVSAATLALMEWFDPHKFSWLLHACSHADAHVSQRALAGIAIALLVHPTRLSLYPELKSHLSMLDEERNAGSQLNRIYIQLLRSKETEKVDKKMREEIIPEMIKNVNIIRNMKFGFEDQGDDNDRNPDWEQALNQPGFEDKIREMNELQMEGADIYMSTFAQLKGYPFFKELGNWFYPFDMHHSSVVSYFGLKPAGDNVLLSLMLHSGFFCNSDKYSLCFTVAHIPQSQREMIVSQMTSQDLNDLMDENRSASLKQYSERPEVISNQYVHDLYRFFKLHPRHNEFQDIFKEEMALHRLPALKEILGKPELLREVADFHFSKEHPAEAADIYLQLIDMNLADADLFQRTGYCLQKEKCYKEAVEAYRKADVLKPDHVWTIRHLATCYRQMRNFEAALENYKKAEAIQPENRNILFFTGSCLAELERYEEALQYFFKLDFLENDCVKAWRAIGWCSFVSGKHEQAMKYYEKVLASKKPVATDYLNAGHVAWRLGRMEKMADYYGEATLESGSKDAFLELFNRDREVLIQSGIAEEEIPLILDLF